MPFDPDIYLESQIAKGDISAKKRGFDPDAYLRGQYMPSGVPSKQGPYLGGDRPAAIIEEKPRTIADYAKALLEVPAGLVTGAAAPFLGAGKGIIQNIQQGTNERVDRPELAQQFMYSPTSPVAQDILEGMGGVTEALKLPPVVTQPAMIPSYANLVKGAAPQVRTGAQIAGQAVAKAAEPVVAKSEQIAQALRKANEPSPSVAKAAAAPSYEALDASSNKLFNTAKQGGVEVNARDFANSMKEVRNELIDKGFDAELHPDINTVMNRLENPNIPKDFNKLKALRTMIADLQSSDTPLKKSLATELKSQFDDYLASIPESSLTGGTPEHIAAWKQARDTYTQLRKSEIFTNMLARAELDKTRFSQSGIENSLTQQLRNLANNQRKMRMFTAEEQQAIRDAVKGGTTQNALRFLGKFAPTGPVSGMFGVGAMMAHPVLGTAFELGSMASRYGATKMRKDEIERLAALMRANAPKPIQGE